MKVDFQPTEYEGRTEKFVYRVHYNPYRCGWVLLRWPVDHPKIPTVGETLTVNGWARLSTILRDKIETKFIEFQDVDEYIEE